MTPQQERKSSKLPTEEEWNEWKQMPCTKLLMEWAEGARLDLMELWATGNFTAAFDVEMAVKNAGATGACDIYAYIKELDYKQIVTGEDDGQQNGPEAAGPSSTG